MHNLQQTRGEENMDTHLLRSDEQRVWWPVAVAATQFTNQPRHTATSGQDREAGHVLLTTLRK